MSEKYSEETFFFAKYGCCIPTESYAWILVVLFITTIVVLLLCILATAVIRWMYKRRMRKRLHDLKRKFLTDQLKAQEFEAKLNYMAQKNKSTKNEDFSREGDKEKFTIVVDPAQNHAHHPNKKVAGPSNKPIYDPDETPIAQSTLASQSNPKATKKKESSWLHPLKDQKKQEEPVVLPSPESPLPPIAPVAPHVIPPPAQYPQPTGYFDPPPGMIGSNQRKSPPKKSSDFDFGSSPIIPIDPNDVTPKITKKNPLAPPTTTSGTSSPWTTAPSSGETTTPATTTPETGTTGSSDGNPTSSVPTTSQSPKSPGDDVTPNLQYEMDIVSPVVPEKESDKGSDKKEVRKEGAGGRGEWKYYSMDGGNKNPSTWSTTTKSSTSYRRSGSWLVDSTGSNRFESASSGHGTGSGTGSGSRNKTNSTVSSSLLKTDSSQYRTASIEQFPHGAFTFQ